MREVLSLLTHKRSNMEGSIYYPLGFQKLTPITHEQKLGERGLRNRTSFSQRLQLQRFQFYSRT